MRTRTTGSIAALTAGLALLFTAHASARPTPSPEVIAALKAQVAQAQEWQKESLPGHGELLRRTAFEFNQIGMGGEAQWALSLVIANPESDFNLAEAYRMSAETHLAAGNRSAAIKAGYLHLAVYDSRPEMKTKFRLSYGGGVSTLAVTLFGTGSPEAALEVNERLLGPDRSGFEEGVVTTALSNKATILERLKRQAEAVDTIDDLLRSYPAYGTADGARLRLRVHRLEMAIPDQGSPEHVAGLRALWNDPQSISSPWILNVALTLSRKLRAGGLAAEAIVLEEAALQRLDAHRAMWAAAEASDAPGARRGADIGEVEVTLLSTLSGADTFGRADAAIRALVRLVPLARNQDERDSLQRQIARVTAALAP